jgi:hypothetical protein
MDAPSPQWPHWEAWRRCQTITSSIAWVAMRGNNMTYYLSYYVKPGWTLIGGIRSISNYVKWDVTLPHVVLCHGRQFGTIKVPTGREVAFQRSYFFGIKAIAVNGWCEHILTYFASTCACCDNAIVGMSLALLYKYNFTHRAWIWDPNIIYHLQDYGPWIMYFIFNGFSIGYIHITLLNNVVSRNMKVGCWELNMNTSLHAHLF